MNDMKLQKWLAGLLAALMLTALLPAAAFAAEAAPLTRGEVCELLLAAADDYNPGVEKTDILKGDSEGNLNEEAAVTRAEALVMLSRAFGDLPAPVGDTARWAYPAETFTDLPAWAETELQNVFQSGIVAGTGAGTFSPDETVTAEQMERVIRRVYAIEGSNLKDDFYATVNREWLRGSTIPDGEAISGGLFTMTTDVAAQVAELISDIAAGKHPKGTDEQKIADLYHNVLDWDARNKAGIAPLKPYLDAVAAAETLDELMAAEQLMAEELGSGMLLGFGLTIDLKDSTKYTTLFGTLSAGMNKEVYLNEGPQRDAYLKQLTSILMLAGDDADTAAARVQEVFEMEQVLSAASLNPEDRNNVDKIYNLYTMEELKALFPNVDLDAVYASSGLKAEDAPVLVMDVGVLEAAATFFDESHLEVLKTGARLGLLGSYGSLLNKEFIEVAQTFQQEFSGVQGTQTDQQIAAAQVQSLLATPLEKVYVKEYFSPEAKQDVEHMIAETVAVYRERIEALEWMSDATKKLALEKLDSLGVKVGYPDVWDATLDKVEIRAAADGGSFFENVIEISKANHAKLLTYQGEHVDKDMWICPAFTVNAFYHASFNDITFPAAVLQAPMYDVEASEAQNLGGIGYVIAHEITHAFDNNGAKFDAQGNAADWWTPSDYAAFQALCDQAVAYYDGVEVIPGILSNGTQTLSENVADLGSAACITEIVARSEEQDYETLYRTMAETWAMTTSRPYYEYLNQIDVHAANKLRGFMPAQTQDAFYEAFDIQPGDGMWVAPEDRVTIW